MSSTFFDFFHIFLICFLHSSSCVLPIHAFKLWTKRRKRDSNPRAALTTYSLSRGAPSASLGISPKRPLSNIHDSFLFVQYFFLIFQNGHLALEYSNFCFRKSLSFFLSGSKKNILFSVYNTFRKFLHDFTENKKGDVKKLDWVFSHLPFCTCCV